MLTFATNMRNIIDYIEEPRFIVPLHTQGSGTLL
jgi:hypothetical protein